VPRELRAGGLTLVVHSGAEGGVAGVVGLGGAGGVVISAWSGVGVFSGTNLFERAGRVITGAGFNSVGELLGGRGKNGFDGVVEKSWVRAGCGDEVRVRRNDPALQLSGGQQQRLCIARALATNPEVLLMDEPASALDPIATQRIEELIHALKKAYTIVIVTHNMQQAARVSDVTAFFWQGRLIECGRTEDVFTAPRERLTEDYVTGRFG